MKKIILFIIPSVLLFACGGTNEDSSSTSITGTLTGLPEGTAIYLDYLLPTELFAKDTAIIDVDGNYSFKYQPEQLGYYRLRINNQNFINLILNVGETPTINGDGTNLMDSYSIEGSEGSVQLKDFNSAIKLDYLYQDSLNKFFQANQNNQQAFIEVQAKSIASGNKLKDYYISIINANPGSLLSLAAVQQLDAEVYIEQYKKVDEAMAKTMSGTPYFNVLHEKVESLLRLATGGEAPNFTLNDRDGNPVSLNDLRGNVVLVDFWASWCRPCRAENPNVVKAYNKYHNKGFEVFSVSLDGMPQQQNAKQDWLTAIEKDGLLWKNHASDLQGWQSSVVPIYGIQGIPFTILIDKEGKVIAKNVRGQALEEKLKEIFG